MRKSLYAAGLAIALFAFTGCDDSPSSPPPPPPPPVRTVASVQVSPASDTVQAGTSITFTATALDSVGAAISGQTFLWSSSDVGVATVVGGVVSGVTAGTATITASVGNIITAVSGTASVTVTAPPPTTFNHVFVVGLLEKDYAQIFPAGAPSMPFLDSLARSGGLATNYFGNAHPSIGNFYMLAVGDTVTTDDNDTTTFAGDNIVRQLVAAGKTWKSYAESIPSAGYIGSDNGLYIRHHNVFVMLSDVKSDTAQRRNVVPLSQLQADITAGTLPNYGMIVPNECNNSHLCPLSTVDAWLRTTLTPLLANPAFQANGLLVILFDRSATSTANGGGRVGMVVVSSRAKVGYTSPTLFQHQSTMRLTLSALGINTFPGASATAPDMKEFFASPW